MTTCLIFALLTENQKLRTLAYIDPLTEVGNRRAYQERIRQAQKLSYIAIDVNSFKQINDTHGHAVGDAVLAAIANLIRSETDFVYRTGGDEFMVVLDAPMSEAKVIACRIQRAIAARPINGIHCTASVGVGQNAKEADRAMYRKKRL
jgi:diguanylate cyclase (GGDEF)-like protein